MNKDLTVPLQDIYGVFKPMPETKTWATLGDQGKIVEVCVSWQRANGYMRWFVSENKLAFEYIIDE